MPNTWPFNDRVRENSSGIPRLSESFRSFPPLQANPSSNFNDRPLLGMRRWCIIYDEGEQTHDEKRK